MSTVSDDGLHERLPAPAFDDGQRSYGISDGGVPSDRTALGGGPRA